MFFLNCAIDIYDDDDYDNEVQHLHGQFLYPDIMLNTDLPHMLLEFTDI